MTSVPSVLSAMPPQRRPLGPLAQKQTAAGQRKQRLVAKMAVEANVLMMESEWIQHKKCSERHSPDAQSSRTSRRVRRAARREKRAGKAYLVRAVPWSTTIG